MKISLSLTKNKRREKIYFDLRGAISKFLNKFIQQSLVLYPIIILTALFCILKIFCLREQLAQNIIP